MNRLGLLLLFIGLTACAARPEAPAVVIEPFSVQDAQRAIDKATNTAQAAATRASVATESRIATEQAAHDSMTATAFPLALQSTQAAMTATALPISISQTAIVDGARIAQAQTQAAYAEFSMTAMALPTVAAAQATRRAGVEQWQSTGEGVSAFGFGVLQFAIFVFLGVGLVALSFALGAWVAFLWRPRFVDGAIIKPSLLKGWSVVYPPALLPPAGASGSGPVVDSQAAAGDSAWRNWFCEMLSIAESRNSIAFQQLADVFGKDRDRWFDNFAAPLVKAGMAEPVRQGKATTPRAGWTIAAMRTVIAGGLTPPHPPGNPPPLPELGASVRWERAIVSNIRRKERSN